MHHSPNALAAAALEKQKRLGLNPRQNETNTVASNNGETTTTTSPSSSATARNDARRSNQNVRFQTDEFGSASDGELVQDTAQEDDEEILQDIPEGVELRTPFNPPPREWEGEPIPVKMDLEANFEKPSVESNQRDIFSVSQMVECLRQSRSQMNLPAVQMLAERHLITAINRHLGLLPNEIDHRFKSHLAENGQIQDPLCWVCKKTAHIDRTDPNTHVFECQKT